MRAVDTTLVCAWCGQPVRDIGRHDAPAYCSRLHQEWAETVAAGGYPVADCPRCGRHDLRIGGPDWAICQTCGYQTDRPDLPAGVLTPRDMNHSMADIKERLERDAGSGEKQRGVTGSRHKFPTFG